MKKKEDKKPKVEDLQSQVIELTEALQRERADATNVRRRAEEDRVKLGSFYKAIVVKELLPVIDNFERALKHAPAVQGEGSRVKGEDEAKLLEWVSGVEKIVKQFEDTLAKLGVERIKTVGEPFDPAVHNAVSHEEGDGKQEVVSEELQSGYLLGDEIIREAMVRVKS